MLFARLLVRCESENRIVSRKLNCHVLFTAHLPKNSEIIFISLSLSLHIQTKNPQRMIFSFTQSTSKITG